MTQMLLQHCVSIFKNSLLVAEFRWIIKSIPFMVLRRLMLGITNVKLQAVRQVLGQLNPRLWFLSFRKVNGFHVYLSQLLVSVCGRGGNHFYSKRLFMILEWRIVSSYISLYLFTWYQNNLLFLYKSIWNEFILVFFPNEVVVHIWNFILASCKLKANSVLDLESQIVYSVVSGACISELVRKLCKQEHLRLSHSILSCESRLNFTQEQNSSWN